MKKNPIMRNEIIGVIIVCLSLMGIVSSSETTRNDDIQGQIDPTSFTENPSSAWFYYGVNTDVLWKGTRHQGTVLFGESPGTNILRGGTWIPENDYPWWVAEYQGESKGSAIWKINASGNFEQVTVNCSAVLYGLEFDPVTERLYGCNVDELYTIDIVTGTATVVGSMPGHHFIDMGISREGQGYGIDLTTDSLYKVNLSDASTELVGPLNIDDFMNIQSCAFDYESEWDDFFLAVDDGDWSLLYYCNINTGECYPWNFLDFQPVTAFVISYGNQHPSAEFTWNPSHPHLGEIILFNASTSHDSDGYIDLYEWDWDNNGKFDESSSSPYITHAWLNGWEMPVTVLVWDNLDGYTMKTKTVTVYGNYPPQAPLITGPVKGTVGVVTEYNFTTTDSNGDWVYYFIDWGDQTNTSWIGPYISGDGLIKSHTWFKKGTYQLRAKAKDINGNESEWETLTVTMPCAYEVPIHRFLATALERFPSIFPILRYFFRYSHHLI